MIRYYKINKCTKGFQYIGFIKDGIKYVLLYQPWSSLTLTNSNQELTELDLSSVIAACFPQERTYENTLDDSGYREHIKAALEQLANDPIL